MNRIASGGGYVDDRILCIVAVGPQPRRTITVIVYDASQPRTKRMELKKEVGLTFLSNKKTDDGGWSPPMARGPETIDRELIWLLVSQSQYVQFYCDGADWLAPNPH